MTITPKGARRAALHEAMGIPEGRMVSMGNLMESTKRKLKAGGGKPVPKPSAKPAKDSDSDYA